jgi:ArsR family transcriptional regulator
MLKQPLGPEALELVARRFAVLAEPLRLRLLMELMKEERHVGALVEAVGGTQGNISRHLQTLAGAGLLKRRREGLNVVYSIADPSVYKLCEVVCGSIGRHLAGQAEAFR